MNDLFSQLQEKAQNGDADAQARLGMCYRFGYDTEKSYSDAVKWLSLSAERGNPLGQMYLAGCYEDGYGVEKDLGKTIALYRLAAQQGLAAAQNSLGWHYHNGTGVPQSHEEAVKWYYLAAIADDRVAQCNLAYCYMEGLGVPKSATQSFYWQKRSAKNGFSTAQLNLCLCYYRGDGTEKSLEDAFHWAYVAAIGGNLDAMRTLGVLYSKGEGVKQSYEDAKKWFLKGAKLGHSDCIYALAHYLYYTEKQYTESEKWAKIAHEKKVPAAAKLLGLCCECGKKNNRDALYWYNKSIEQGVDAKADVERVKKKIDSEVSVRQVGSNGFDHETLYPVGTFSGLDRDSSIAFVNRCLKDDLAFCSSEEERRMVQERYRSNYPNTPLEDYASSYSSTDSSFDDKSYLDSLNDIM